MLNGKTVGIMGLANKPTDFTDEDAETAELFGELAAIALQNSRYLDLLGEKTELLEKVLAEVKTLHGLLPICSYCKKIRDKDGKWNQIEIYIRDHSQAEFTHSYCDDCYRMLMKKEGLDN